MDSAIRKIQKALKLADGNANAEEAQSAMLLAQRLMAKHGLSVSDIGGGEDQKAPEAGKDIIRRSKVEWWHRKLLLIIADNFRCYSFFSSGRYVGFLGLPDDVAIAIEVYQFAESAIANNSRQYLKINKRPSYSRKYANAMKNDYITGFLQGLRDKFKEQIREESLSLVLVKHEVVVQAHDDAGWKTAKVSHINSACDGQAREQGYRDGRSYNNPTGKMIG